MTRPAPEMAHRLLRHPDEMTATRSGALGGRLGIIRGQRGFTLVELMITVAIVAVLAALAMVGYSRWKQKAKTAEASSMIASIKGAQDVYRGDALKFLDCTNGGKTLTPHYPTTGPNDQKQVWDTSTAADPVGLTFRKLGINADNQVYYVYSCAAGPADGTTVKSSIRTFGTATDVWFMVRAVGDLDNNGQQSIYESSSFDGTINCTNCDE